MAAANTNTNATTKTAAEQAKANTEQVKSAAERAKTNVAAATKAAADKTNENANKFSQNAAKVADQATAQMKTASEKARQGSTEMTDKVLKNFEQGGKQFEQNAAHIQEFNSAIVASSKAGSRAVVDQYETAAKGLFDLQRKVAGATKVEWMKGTATAQIQFAEDVTKAWAKAARALIK